MHMDKLHKDKKEKEKMDENEDYKDIELAV